VVISDFVADRRAATPSAAAELLSPDRAQVTAQFAGLQLQLVSRLRQALQRRSERLDWLVRRARQCAPARRLQQQAQRLDELQQRLERAWRHSLAQRRSAVQALSARLRQQTPTAQLQRLRTYTAQLAQRLKYCISIQLSVRREKLAGAVRALDAISPLATLQRGYSITLSAGTGKVLHQAADTAVGELLETRLARGRVISQVREVKKT
jgi:exodeoxyribonuclease VII large subunit